ncbi:hypothetical protein RUM43_007221 [Polyplax serrata]|uniref:Peptidase S1 domain-containing protein n=1 Tax=Polyplax serrata TaxID=468196 RepID=A0AAN8PCB2_POLSC
MEKFPVFLEEEEEEEAEEEEKSSFQLSQIKPKPCSVNGVEGTCMFVYECIKTDGKHVGMCVDNFMFGSCCSHNVKQNSIIPHQNHHNHHQSSSNVLYSSSNVYSSPRPPNHASGGRPQSNKHRPSKPVGFVTNLTKKPSPSSHHWFKEPITASTTSQKQLGMAKPWTHRPPSFVTSSNSSLKPSFPEVKFPLQGISSDSNQVTQSVLIVSNNSSPAVDRTSTAATTNFSSSSSPPSSSIQSSTYSLIATSRPFSAINHPTVNTKEYATTLSASTFTMTTTAASSPTLTIRTTTTTSTTTAKPSKPSWVGSPPAANHLLPPSKPSTQLSKPDYWISEKPNFYSNQASWVITNKPHFVTRPRPTSNFWSKPNPTKKPVIHAGMSSIRSNLTNGDANERMNLTTTTVSTTLSSGGSNGSNSSSSSSGGGSFGGSTSSSSRDPSTTTRKPETTTAAVTTAETTTATPANSKVGSKYQYSGQCGVAALSPRPEMRIVGGKNAAFGGWPWQVSVRRTSFFGFSSTHRCGGAVINENWIATAGHCVDDLLTSQIRIRVGEYDFSSVQEPYPFVERGVSKKVVHPKYNFFTYEYDLALVRLESSLEFQPHISPICLPATDDLLIGENATVTGWGRLSEGGTLPSVLQQVSS